MRINLRKGFTLAELLITLAIIGVVAAMTLPMLTAKYQKMVIETKLKKFYSTLAQATQRAVAKHGDMRYWNYSGSVKTLYETYYKGELSAYKPYFITSDTAYILFHDGTCAVLRNNMGLSNVRGYYWQINLDCGKRSDAGGVNLFEVALFNFINPRIRCNYTPTGCGWPGDTSYNDNYANNLKDTSTCDIGSPTYAWKNYQCFHKIMSDGFKIKDDYKFEQQPKPRLNVNTWKLTWGMILK